MCERDGLKERLCEAVAEYGLSNVIAAASHPEATFEEPQTNFDLGNLLVEMYITLQTDRPDLRS